MSNEAKNGALYDWLQENGIKSHDVVEHPSVTRERAYREAKVTDARRAAALRAAQDARLTAMGQAQMPPSRDELAQIVDAVRRNGAAQDSLNGGSDPVQTGEMTVAEYEAAFGERYGTGEPLDGAA
jgi:hypothetical protein